MIALGESLLSLSQDSYTNVYNENKPNSSAGLIPHPLSKMESQQSLGTPNTKLHLEKDTSVTTAALRTTDSNAHQKFSVHTIATAKELTHNPIGKESITPPQSLPNKSKLPHTKKENHFNPYKIPKLGIRSTQDKMTKNPPKYQRPLTYACKKRQGSATFGERAQRKRHQSFATDTNMIMRTTADKLIRSLKQACPFCKSPRCAGQICRKKSTRCFYCTLHHHSSTCDTKYKAICRNCKKPRASNKMKSDGNICCAVMSPVVVDNLFKKMSEFLTPQKVCVHCFDSFVDDCKNGQHACKHRLREIIIRHATINKTLLVDTVREIFMSRESRTNFLASVDINKLRRV